MISYAETGIEPSFDDRALTMAFVPIKRRMDKDTAAYMEKCRKNQENGRLGGRPRKDENRTVFDETERFLEKPKKPDTDTDTDTDTETVNYTDNIRYWGSIDYEGSAVVVPLSTGKTYTITPERIAELQKVYREISVPSELNIMAEVMRSSPSKRKTETQIELTINHWLQNARSRAIGQNKIAEAKAPKKKLTPAEEVDTWTITL